MQSLFYVSHSNQQMGPFSTEEIQDLLKKGELHIADYVYVESREDWILLSDFLTLQSPTQLEVQPRENVAEAAQEVISQETVPQETEKSQEEPQVQSEQKVETPSVEASEPQKETTKSEPVIKVDETFSGQQAPPTNQIFESMEKTADTLPPQQTSSPSATTPTATDNSVSLKEGSANWEWTSEQIGQFTLTFSVNGADGELRSVEHNIVVKPGQASQIRWTCSESPSVTEPAEVTFETLDKFGNSTAFEGQIEVTPSNGAPEVLNFEKGRCLYTWKSEATGTQKLNVQCLDQPLGIESQPEVEFKAGPFHSVRVDVPESAAAGEKVVVTIYAVDQFGNTLSDFDGTVRINQADVSFHNGVATAAVSEAG